MLYRIAFALKNIIPFVVAMEKHTAMPVRQNAQGLKAGLQVNVDDVVKL